MADAASTHTARNPQIALPRDSESAADSRNALPTGPRGSSSSASAACQRPASAVVNSGHPRNRLLAHGHRRGDPFRKIDVDTGTAADEPDALTLRDLRAGTHVRHDPARHRASDLHHLDVTERGLEMPHHALVLVAVLVESRQEPTRHMLHGGDISRKRCTIDVDV